MRKPGPAHKRKKGRGVTDLPSLYYRQGGRCKYCARPMSLGGIEARSATRDHVVPRASGGKQAGNLVAACRDCNARKANMTLDDFKTLTQHSM